MLGRHTQMWAQSVKFRLLADGAMQKVFKQSHFLNLDHISCRYDIFEGPQCPWVKNAFRCPRWLIDSLGQARTTLVCSTTHYVGYWMKAWYATMAGMLFLPPIVAVVAYIFAICRNVTSPIVSPMYSRFIPAATVLLYAYTEILIFCCGEHHFYHRHIYS